MRGILPLAILTLILGSNLAGGQALLEPLPPILIITNPPFPRAGDNLTVDIYTFQAGQAVDLDGVPNATFRDATALLNGSQRRLPEGNPLDGFRRVGLGHYRGYVQLPWEGESASRAAAFGGGLVEVTGSRSGEGVSQALAIRWLIPGLYLRVRLDPASPLLGQEAEVTVEVFDGIALVDPSSIHVTFQAPSPEDNVEMVPVRHSTGLYVANFILPTFSHAYRPFNIWAEASLGPVVVERTLRGWAALPQLWFHRTFVNETVTRGELWVADFEGQPAKRMGLGLVIWGPGCPSPCLLSGLTDDEGRLEQELVVSGRRADVDVEVGDYDGIRITVRRAPLLFGGLLPLDPPLLPDGTARDYLRPGTPVTRVFQLQNRSGPGGPLSVTNRDLTYYVHSRHEVVGSGLARTDGDGVVEVTFTPPQGDGRLSFLVDESLFFWDFAAASSLLGLRAGPLTLGGLTEVEGTVTPGLQETVNTALPRGELPVSVAHLSPNLMERWERWTPPPGGPPRLPPFLPPNGSFLVKVSLPTEIEGATQFAVLRVGESVEIPVAGENGLSIWLPVGLAAGIGSLAVVAYFGFRSWKGRKGPPEHPGDPSGPP